MDPQIDTHAEPRPAPSAVSPAGAWQLRTPVAFLVFARPQETAKVFEQIRLARPPRLLVVADGPRAGRPGEAERCAAVRAVIDRGVDWDCEVLTHYATENMGCKGRVSSGLNWVFQQVPEAIVLEDDCVPHPDFFRFCQEMLDRYREDERVMMVTGDNFQYGWRRAGDAWSYYFSRYLHIWGWATWRRAWAHYDLGMKLWPQVREGRWLEDVFGDARAAAYWTRVLDRMYAGQIDTWDYPWFLSVSARNGVSVIPNVNMVTNIGTEAAGTHITGRTPMTHLPAHAADDPLVHPPLLLPNTEADRRFTRNLLYPTLPTRIARRLRRMLG